MTSNANTHSSFRKSAIGLLDKHVVIPRVEEIFLAKSWREKPWWGGGSRRLLQVLTG